MSTVATRVPSIPAVTPSNMQEVARSIKGLLDVREGRIGDPLDAHVTYRALIAAGLARASLSLGGGGTSVVEPPSGVDDGDYDPVVDLTPPPAPENLLVTAGLTVLQVKFDLWTYPNHAYAEVWRSATNVQGNAVMIGTTLSQFYADAIGATGVAYYYWVRFISQANVAGPFNAVDGTLAQTGKIGNVDLGPLIIEAGNLASGAVTATKIADGAIGSTKFANGIEPVSVVAALPSPTGYAGPKTVLLTTDGKLYRYVGGVWTAAVPAADVAGQLTDSQIASIGAAKLTGTIASTQISDDAITTPKLAANAVTANEIAAGSILASKMTLTDTSNVYPDYDMVDQSFYSGDPFTLSGTSSAVCGRQILTITADAAQRDVRSGAIQLEASTDYRIDLQCALNAVGTGVAEVYIELYSMTSAGTLTLLRTLLVLSRTDTNTLVLGGIDFVTASTERRAKLLFRRGAGGATTSRYGGVVIRRRANASLIVDGSITALKVAADAITADAIAANAITAGKIAAGAISADQIAAGAITTDKLLVTGRGAALNDDPACSDISAWAPTVPANASVVALTDGNIGNTALRGASGVHVYSRAFPVSTAKKYRVRAVARKSSTATGTFYLRMYCYDAAGTQLSFASGVEAQALTTAWATFKSADLTPPAGTVTAKVTVVLNYNTATGYHEAQDVRCEECVGADLIVDGAIIATKLAANSIAVGTAAIQNGAIVNAMMGNAAIDTAEIADAAIVTAHIGDAQITNAKIIALDAAKITTGFLSAARIAANSITASLIDSRGLSIKDASGNIILAAGSPLAAANITPSSGWLNSGISISSGGVLSGAGGGTVTIGGLGYTGDLNATQDITFVTQGAGTMTVAGNSLTKATGTGAWDTQAYSKEAYVGGAAVSFAIGAASKAFMLGLNADPAADANYTGIDFAWYVKNDNTLEVREAGAVVDIGSPAYAVGDILAITYDGAKVRYYRNGTLEQTTTTTANKKLYVDSSFNTVGGKADNVKFTYYGNPSAVSPTNPITGANASTFIASAAIGWAEIGDLDIATTGAVHSGQTAYNTGVGFWVGYSGGVPKLSIGDPSGNSLVWNGSQLIITTDSTNLVSTGVKAPRVFVSATGLGGNNGIAGAEFWADGNIKKKINGTVSSYTAWYSPITSAIGSSYWIRFSKLSQSGGSLSASLGSWLSMGSTNFVTLSTTGVNAEYTASIFFEISTTSGGTNIVASGQVDLFASREP